jgi:transcription initiation factor TFIIB
MQTIETDRLVANGYWNNKCPFCRNAVVLDFESGERVCTSCGMVLGHEYSPPEPRITPSRALSSQTLESSDFGFGQTFIDRRNIDSKGKKITTENLQMIRKLDGLALSDDSDRYIKRAMEEIRRTSERLGVGLSVQREAMSIYCKAYSMGLIRGRTVEGICTASIYVACRKLNVPRLLDDIAEIGSYDETKSIAPYCKLLIRKLGIRLPQIAAAGYVDSIARNASISAKTQREALSILALVGQDPTLSGKKPISLAAAALYLAARTTAEHTSQLRIASASNLTPTTVRKTSLQLENILKPRNTPLPDMP